MAQRSDQVRAEHLEIHRPAKTLKLITQAAQPRQPIIDVEKSRVTHQWIELDNDTIERSIRPLTLQRKHAPFTGHDLGAENWATFASLIETCKLGGINPQAYLTDVLARIILLGDADPINDLLPYNRVDSRPAASAIIDHAA
ncbi:transposase domain-containing protein [Sphingobium psychrophilum]|uniref:transposase domain-containing protein n=1 Tax=Sphingobium psychrophilum TaxID=2728834 RepID=UPI002E28AA7C|nr:transposase domain-containing protein [Sphingobium psychrophilum]